ncbi:DUF6588 family protein [Rufibacter hautae]|uniref:Uncharacterized protein n=1 Tax=Rufibacter hautae TaxID=2595005 RepID=A0A5B6TAK9_9BACT|nr:DUF6588 family protein [Rufibacter hautae]KAA3436143.1 hypothetical protein FOA19_17215 [Rufibacter hautae]
MRNNLFKLSFWAMPVLGLFLAASPAQAQDEVGEFIRAGKEDANKLVRAYAEPASKAFGHGLNGGWFNSGKAMKLGRFDVRVFATAAFSPEEDRTFDIAKLGLTMVRDANGNRFDPNKPVITPTIFGEDEEGPEISLYAKANGVDERIGSINAPQGSGYKFLPVPMAQVSLGLIQDTEIAVRYSPKVKYDDFEGQLLGFGVKHGIKQYIPVISMIPGFDITVFGGYTNLKSSYSGIDVPLSEEDRPYATAQQRDANYYTGQALTLNTKAWTASLVASKTFSVLTGYAGVRYSNVETDLNVEGKFPVLGYRTNAPFNKYVEDITDPVLLNMKDSQWGLTGGLRLKLLVFSLYGEYTLAKYPTATAGIGIGFN